MKYAYKIFFLYQEMHISSFTNTQIGNTANHLPFTLGGGAVLDTTAFSQALLSELGC